MENNMDRLCRICVKESLETVSLFNNKFPQDGTVLADFLRQITNLEILENDGLPNTICVQCLEKLTNAFELVQLCLTSNIILKNSVNDSDETAEDTSEIFEINTEQKIKKYECEVCGISFTNKTKFKIHQKTHDDNNLFKCNDCSQSFSKKINLTVHLRSHIKEEDKKYSCTTCHKQFAYAYLLKQHEYKHTDSKPFPCKFCDKGCLTAESLRRHVRVHDKDYVKRKHSCQICLKEFAYPSFLAEHMKNHTGEKPHLCSICGKGFRQSGALHYHQRVHTGYKPFKCKICNGNFMSQSVLKVHMRKHTNERPFVCHICGVAFRQSTDLKSHQRTHTGDKPVLCTICGKRMSTTGQLTIHIRSHTGEKPFVCLRCCKSFTTRTMLVKHERIHTGERPYVCDICGRAFNQSSTLRTHKNTHLNTKKRVKKVKPKDKNVIKLGFDGNCDLYKNDVIDLGEGIVTNEFIGEGVQDIKVVKNDEGGRTQFTVILPEPIPLLHNL